MRTGLTVLTSQNIRTLLVVFLIARKKFLSLRMPMRDLTSLTPRVVQHHSQLAVGRTSYPGHVDSLAEHTNVRLLGQERWLLAKTRRRQSDFLAWLQCQPLLNK